eukprot:1136294-Pelagomonas_calceolata.AAC.1
MALGALLFGCIVDDVFWGTQMLQGLAAAAVCFYAGLRDFTINAIFFDPLTGDVLDFVGGVQDLKNKVRVQSKNVECKACSMLQMAPF